MNLAIDYATYSAARPLWSWLIDQAQRAGYGVVCTTRSRGPVADLPPGVVLVPVHDDYPRRAVERLGVDVDTWITASPGLIEPPRVALVQC